MRSNFVSNPANCGTEIANVVLNNQDEQVHQNQKHIAPNKVIRLIQHDETAHGLGSEYRALAKRY